VAGLRDAVVDGKTGILVPYGSSHALSIAITTILNNTRLRQNLRNGALDWSKKFEWRKSAEQAINLTKGSV
jgi:glycosyltransferase involved in cell wall biosynthesis